MFEGVRIGTNIYGFPLFCSEFRQVVDFITAAETLGYDHLRFYDHVIGNAPVDGERASPYSDKSTIRECFTLMSYIAAITSRLELVSGVIVLPQRQTVLVAKQAAEIDILSNGRLTLGVGIGYNRPEFEALGAHFADRAARFEEQINVLRLLWTTEVVNFDGHYHRLENIGLAPRPLQRPIPIFFGMGSVHSPVPSDRVLERCGRLADGWLPSFQLDEAAKTAVIKMREAARACGRDPAKIALELNVATEGRTPDTIRDEIRRYRDFGASRINLQLGGHSAAEQTDSLKRIAEALRLAA